MNSFMNNLTNATNYTYTQNGALAHKTTRSAILDMFALGGAYRQRSDEDCILLFKNALDENESLAIKCLFYLRDIRGGQGERRFFRVCFNWLVKNNKQIASRNLINISEYGRWDDLIYSTVDTYLWNDAMSIIKDQLYLDIECKTPSLMAKWLPSENASSNETKRVGNLVRQYLGMTHKEYRKILSGLRAKINIVERLMSSGQWDRIEFDKIPSKAGLVYKNAFARRDIIAKKYETFANDKNTTVNAAALYPYEIVAKAVKNRYNMSGTDRAMLEKYWENQIDVLQGKPCNMLCVCDTSGSMTGNSVDAPINIAIGLSMYCAERAGGPFKDHYISFSSRPQLIKVEGTDFVDKVYRIYNTNLCDNTNLIATFDLLKSVALKSNPKDIPETIIVISDMQIDSATGPSWTSKYNSVRWTEESAATEMEKLRKEWAAVGLKLPKLVYWNVNASKDTFLDLGEGVSFVSGASPMLFKQVLTGKTGFELMTEILMGERYELVY